MDKLIGQQFGRWTVLKKEGVRYLTRCDCGREGRAAAYDLRHGKTKGCRACNSAARVGRGNPSVRVHGLSDSPTQWVWSDMKRRCYSPHRRGYENYGGRGIRICNRWLRGDGTQSGFACFLADMGERPSKNHQIDRIDNDGHYTPENCRWIPRDAQNYNKRNTFRFSAFGRELTLADAESIYGIKKTTLFQRLYTHKMPPELALTKPLRQTRRQAI